MDEDAVDALDLPQPLVELHVGDDAAREHEVAHAGLLQILRHVRDRDFLEDALVRRGDVDLREVCRQQPREIHVVRLDDAEPAVVLHEAAAQQVAQHRRIAVGRETDDLALVPARRESECRRHRLVERAERVREFLTVQPLDLAAAAEVDAAREARPVAVECDDERFVEAALVVGVRRVGEVMLDALELLGSASSSPSPASSSCCQRKWNFVASRPHFSELRFATLRETTPSLARTR